MTGGELPPSATVGLLVSPAEGVAPGEGVPPIPGLAVGLDVAGEDPGLKVVAEFGEGVPPGELGPGVPGGAGVGDCEVGGAREAGTGVGGAGVEGNRVRLLVAEAVGGTVGVSGEVGVALRVWVGGGEMEPVLVELDD